MTLDQAIQLALQHHQAGRLAEAEQIYRQILSQAPDQPDALRLLATVVGQAGQVDAAIDLLERAVQLQPNDAQAYGNLGQFLRQKHRLESAMAAWRRVIELQPDWAEAHRNLGVVLLKFGRAQESVDSLRRAIDLNPDDLEALCELGNALLALGRGEEAIAAHRQAIQTKPDYAEAHYSLGIALYQQGQLDEAISSFNRAIQIQPGIADIHNNLGNALRAAGRHDEAIAACKRAIAIRPDFAGACTNLGNTLKDTGRLDEAIAAYRRAVKLEPLSDTMHSNLVYALLFHPGYDARAIFEELREWNEIHAVPLRASIRPHDNDRDPNRRLRLGYVSPDFRSHSVAYFLEGPLANHDHNRFEIFCYSDVSRPDEVTDRLKSYADHWRDLPGVTDASAAEMIRADRIDILIDLAGHTAGNRMSMFARKPAPVQATWIGHPGTTGLATMDYRITDAWSDPTGNAEAHHTETLVRLPRTFLCYTPREPAQPVGELPAIQAGRITFGSFNSFAKVTPQAMDLWARILSGVPHSRLMIKAFGLDETSVRRSVGREFQRVGIAEDRLTLIGWQPSIAEHLAEYNRVDVALDTFPYNGTTTTCEAMWMGVPVITLAGAMHAGRVGVSVLTNIGLPELIARTPEEYQMIATNLAGDLNRLSNLRRRLRDRMKASPLMDAAGFTRDLETAYRNMWHRWVQIS